MKLKFWRRDRKNKVNPIEDLVTVIDQLISNPICINHRITKDPDPTPLIVHLEFTKNGQPHGRRSIQESDCKGFPITLIDDERGVIEVSVRLEKRR
jgi:hypothetical protein